MNGRQKHHADGISKNLLRMRDDWRACFDEMGRNGRLLLDMFAGKADIRPIHYLWGIWTALVGIPYRTWAFAIPLHVIAETAF